MKKEYIFEQAFNRIAHLTGISHALIIDVIEANDVYLREIGVLDLSEEEIRENYDYYRERLLGNEEKACSGKEGQ